ncbi:MAG: hypothetical protein LAO31_11810 [Acidobacteriia bacterium]|nr:hypothetical protein [Terriglobia bacterium]
MKEYLLGQIPEEEKAALEEGYFADDRRFEDLLMVEDELIDDYVLGALSAEDRALFEKAYLTVPQRREKVEIAKGLIKALGPGTRALNPEGSSSAARSSWGQNSLLGFFRAQGPLVRFAVIAGGLIVVVGTSLLIDETIRLHSRLNNLQIDQEALKRQAQSEREKFIEQQTQSNQMKVELERERSRRLQLEKEQNRSTPMSASIVSFDLFPGLSRDIGESRRLIVPKSAEWVRFRLALEEESRFETYSVALQTVEGKGLWSQNELRPIASRRGRVIVVQLRPAQLPEGDSILMLSGTLSTGERRELADYVFSILKK